MARFKERAMRTVDGALALDLGFETTADEVASPARLSLAPSPSRLHGPDKYRVLEHRRRQAQIKARRALADVEE